MREPVRDWEGNVVWRVRVAPGELTCTGCGETTSDYCPRCGGQDEDGKTMTDAPKLVPTLSYLREGEWESI